MLIGIASAALVALGVAAAVALAVLSRPDQARAGNTVRPYMQHIKTDTGTTAPAPAVTPGPRAVVDSYFAAINNRNWPRVWRLGGQHLNSSYQDMVDGYVSTARDVLRSVTITGDHAIVRVRAYETSGVLQVYEMDILIQDGMIVRASQQLIGPGS